MLPWAEMMRQAMSLGISPKAFWPLSVREWLWLTHTSAAAGFSRDTLKALIEEHPDG